MIDILSGPIELCAEASVPLDAAFFVDARKIADDMGLGSTAEYRARRKNAVRYSVVTFPSGTRALLAALIHHTRRADAPSDVSVGDPIRRHWQ